MLTIIQQLCSMKQEHTRYTEINLCTAKQARCDKTKPNPENFKNCSSKCAYDCEQPVHNTTQNSSDNLPSYLQTTVIAQMLSIRGEGALIRNLCMLMLLLL